MIQELYLKRAATIRRDYLKIVKDIESYEKRRNFILQEIKMLEESKIQ